MNRSATLNDARFIATIYNEYVANSYVTFEEKVISEQNMASRIVDVQGLNLPWLVATDDENHIVGYAYASPWKQRSAYRYSVEITVYLTPALQGKGWGHKIVSTLICAVEARQYSSSHCRYSITQFSEYSPS